MTSANQAAPAAADATREGGTLGRLRRSPLLVAAVAGAVAIVAGAALAVAPVVLDKTTVSWPAEGAATTGSTVLLLTNQTPYTLDISFDESAVASATDEVLVATMTPGRDDARIAGLVIETDGDDVLVSSGYESARIPASAGDDWALHSDVTSGMTLSVDGREQLSWPGVLPPQVDALVTETTGVTASSLSASMVVVDDPNSHPGVVKIGLIVILLLALGLALVSLHRDDRGDRSPSETTRAAERRPWWRRLMISDGLVIGALVLWTFIGPMTDDDGYYANMSLNYGAAGYVGNYFQMFNQPFTPFTWFWQFLYFWQELGGRSPVWLRVPALIAATVAWFLTRRILDRLLADRHRRFTGAAHLLLGVVFVAWWSAYTIGSRPEAVGALASIVTLTLVLRAATTRTLLPAAFAALAAGISFAAHPTGGVAFAPLVLAIPTLWSIARRAGASVPQAVGRTVAVLSVGSIALLAAFGDATLHDMLLSQARFAAVETPLSWQQEAARYALLFSDAPMGSYAKRAVVLIALVTLLWFIVLWVAGRVSKRGTLPIPFALLGWSFGLALIALWITTSKWTHHFGALSSLGPLLIVATVMLAPAAVGRIIGAERLPGWLPVVAALSYVPAAVVSLDGPNSWAYAWEQFLYADGQPPRLGPIQLSSPAVWALIALAVITVTVFVMRRRRIVGGGAGSLHGATAFVAVFLIISTGFLYSTFTIAAVRGIGSYSVGGAALADPTGRECRTENAIQLWDATRGIDLTPVAASSESSALPARLPGTPTRYTPDMLDNGALTPSGYPASDPVPPGAGTVWGSSLSGSAGARSTDWYRLPESLEDGRDLVALVGGHAGPESGSGLLVEFGRIDADGSVTVDRQNWVTDSAERPGWKTLRLGVTPEDLGADSVVRLIGIDGSADVYDWFGFGAPRVVAPVSMGSLERIGQPSLVAWQMNFWFPCSVPITIADGVIQPPTYATTWGEGSPDNIWVPRRGGALAGVSRIAEINTPATEMTGVGPLWGRVNLFDYPYPTDGFSIAREPMTVSGLSSPFGPPSQLVEFQRIQDPNRPGIEMVQ